MEDITKQIVLLEYHKEQNFTIKFQRDGKFKKTATHFGWEAIGVTFYDLANEFCDIIDAKNRDRERTGIEHLSCDEVKNEWSKYIIGKSNTSKGFRCGIFTIKTFNQVMRDANNIPVPNKIAPEKYGHKRKIPQGYEIFNDDWALSSTGDMFCIESYYEIYDYLLAQSHWILHLMEKRWFDANTFIPAYFEACKRAGIKEVRIKTYF